MRYIIIVRFTTYYYNHHYTIFHIDKHYNMFSNIHINNTMHTCDTLPSHQLATQSQIIETLNSSIQDLMSKILKVKNDYEFSTIQQSHTHQRYCSGNLEDNTILLNNQKSKNGFNKGKSKFEENSSTNQSIQTSKNKNGYLQNEPYRTEHHHFPNKTATMYNLAYNLPPTIINKASSSKNIQKEIKIEPTTPKLLKINSLFDSPCIKSVAESHIFSQNSAEGKYQTLQKQTRQANQVMIKSWTEMSFTNMSLSQFELGPQVGSGKFGEVYICRHKATGFVFALKKIFKSTIKQYKMESQFCLELKILYMLNHPNIIKLYAHFHDQYHIFLLMEYVEGGQLLSKLKSNERYVSRVIEQVISAVQYIHDRQIIHRDIKPQNIVVSFDNTIKLCDFGWAGFYNYKDMKTTFCGTLDYVSPQMKDIGIYTSKVDLWSIGVLTFQLLTGNAPFKEEINDWKKKGSKRSVPWDWHIKYPTQVSGLGQSFMRNLLRENPDQRASLRFCKNHYFIRKYKQQQSEINIQIYI